MRTIARFAGLFVGATLLAGQPAMAARYVFSEGGYADGATISGSFTGTDLDHDDRLSGGSEISDIDVRFSGNAIVPAFHLNDADTIGLYLDYDLDGRIGDDADEDIVALGDDLYRPDPHTALFTSFLLGPPDNGRCDGVTDCASVSSVAGHTAYSMAPAQVSLAAPEPASLTLLIAGLGLVGGAMRRRAPRGIGHARGAQLPR